MLTRIQWKPQQHRGVNAFDLEVRISCMQICIAFVHFDATVTWISLGCFTFLLLHVSRWNIWRPLLAIRRFRDCRVLFIFYGDGKYCAYWPCLMIPARSQRLDVWWRSDYRMMTTSSSAAATVVRIRRRKVDTVQGKVDQRYTMHWQPIDSTSSDAEEWTRAQLRSW